jgi:hypothetical protein
VVPFTGKSTAKVPPQGRSGAMPLAFALAKLFAVTAEELFSAP